MTIIPERKLIEKCIKGERKSQKELYNIYSPRMFAICLQYSKNEMDAEDILQEGFIRVFKNLYKFRGEGSFEGWIRKIIVNSAIEHIRRKHVSTTVAAGLENLVSDPQHNALDNLYEKDIINTSLTLSEGYKTVFNLYAVEGYSHKEISDHLGISESTSKSQLSRARAILRSLIRKKTINIG